MARKTGTRAIALAALFFAVLTCRGWYRSGLVFGNSGFDWSGFGNGLVRVGYSFFVGALLSRARQNGFRAMSFPCWTVILAFLMSMLLTNGPVGQALLVLAGFPALVAIAAEAKALPVGARPAAWLASASYPLYALHRPLHDLGLLALPNTLQPHLREIAIAALTVAVSGTIGVAIDAAGRRCLDTWLSRISRPQPIAEPVLTQV